MRDVDARIVTWLSGVLDLMREPSAAMPVRPLIARLRDVFTCSGGSWNWSEPDGSFGMIIDPPEVLLAERGVLDGWLSGELLDCHALMAWFTLTGNPSPFTTARVPTSVVPRQRRILVERPLARLGMEQQLSIPYRMAGPMQYAFVVARGGHDFDEGDLRVAAHVQRSLCSLDRQTLTLGRLLAASGSLLSGSDLGLSGREMAVLQLVADGHSTRVTARRLGCSPRTVEKHLERCYRKLGVCDRLNAIRVARLSGVLGVTPPDGDGPIAGYGEFRGPVARRR